MISRYRDWGYTNQQIIDMYHSEFYRYLDHRPVEFRFEEKRYIVTASSTRGAHRPEEGDTIKVWYEGDDYEQAVQQCNTLDERRDAWFEKVNLPMDAMSVAMRKFDALKEQVEAGWLG